MEARLLSPSPRFSPVYALVLCVPDTLFSTAACVVSFLSSRRSFVHSCASRLPSPRSLRSLPCRPRQPPCDPLSITSVSFLVPLGTLISIPSTPRSPFFSRRPPQSRKTRRSRSPSARNFCLALVSLSHSRPNFLCGEMLVFFFSDTNIRLGHKYTYICLHVCDNTKKEIQKLTKSLFLAEICGAVRTPRRKVKLQKKKKKEQKCQTCVISTLPFLKKQNMYYMRVLLYNILLKNIKYIPKSLCDLFEKLSKLFQ